MIQPLFLLGYHDKVSLSGNEEKFKFCFTVCDFEKISSDYKVYFIEWPNQCSVCGPIGRNVW